MEEKLGSGFTKDDVCLSEMGMHQPFSSGESLREKLAPLLVGESDVVVSYCAPERRGGSGARRGAIGPSPLRDSGRLSLLVPLTPPPPRLHRAPLSDQGTPPPPSGGPQGKTPTARAVASLGRRPPRESKTCTIGRGEKPLGRPKNHKPSVCFSAPRGFPCIPNMVYVLFPLSRSNPVKQ